MARAFTSPAKWNLTKSHPFANGLVILSYRLGF
jgi:hypothetical protein